jgi:hypothetical protein
MHPTTGYYSLAQAHLAGLRHQAQRTAPARAARRAQPRQSRHAVSTPPSVGRRMLAALGARST